MSSLRDQIILGGSSSFYVVLIFYVLLIFEVVFIFEIVFIFKVIFIFDVFFIFKVPWAGPKTAPEPASETYLSNVNKNSQQANWNRWEDRQT